MSSVNVKEWLDKNFEDFQEYLVEVKTPEGEQKEFLVVAEVSQQLGGAVYEFTKNGGEFIGYEEVDLDSPDIDSVLEKAESLIVSEHLFEDEGQIDMPLILDLPDISKTPIDKIVKRFEDYARIEGQNSHVEEFDSYNAPSELSSEVLKAAMQARESALKEVADSPDLTMESAANFAISGFFNDFKEKHDLHDAYGDAYYSDGNGLRDFASWADELLMDLGIDSGLSDSIRNAFEEGCMEKDNSRAIDWLDQEATINFHPTVSPDGSLDDGMITCNSTSGDAFNVVPDDNLKEALAFLNISGQEYEDALKQMSGGNFIISRDNDEWADLVKANGSLDSWCPKSEPEKGQLVSPENLFEIIENTNGYGVFCWSINVNLKDLLSVPPGERVDLSGGQIGIHDYANGSGHMEGYAVGEKEIDLDKTYFVPDQLKRHNLDAVYGMTKNAMDGDLKWPKESKQRYLSEKMDLFIEGLKESGLPNSKEDISVDESSNGFYVNNEGRESRIKDIYKKAESAYGKRPNLDNLLTDKDRDDLGIKKLSNNLSL